LPNPNSSAYYDATTGWDQNAWGWGAGPGIREADFINQFKNGLKFSVCEADYSLAMAQIGQRLAAQIN
jgi:hypothetical protein